MPRVMFLHGLEGAPGTEKQKLMEYAIGKKNVKAPNLRSRETITIFTISFFAVVALLIVATVICFVKVKVWVGIVVLITSVIVVVVVYFIAGRGATHFMLRQAIGISEKRFHEFRPNIIAASSFGAVVALHMDVPRCPLLLFAPAQDQFSRYMRMKHYLSIKEYPYVMIVHGSNDKTVPLEDSIRLIETSEVGRCRLEVVEDNHSLKSLTQDEMKGWIEEVYTRGKQEVQNMSLQGNKHVDPSLFPEDVSESPTLTGMVEEPV